MESAEKVYHSLLAKQLLSAWERLNIEGYYCADRKTALDKLVELIPYGSSISCGGSSTLHEIGIRDIFKNDKYHFFDPDDVISGSEKDIIAHQALSADFFLMSANAIAATGELVNVDGYGNRVAALIFGPKQVVVVAGINKVMPTLDAAIERVKNYAAPLIMLHFKKDYASLNELQAAAELAQSQFVITKRVPIKGRLKVILVDEVLGY